MKIEIENNVVRIVGATDDEFFEVVRFVRNLAAKSPALPPAQVKAEEAPSPTLALAPPPAEPEPRTPPRRKGAQTQTMIAGADELAPKILAAIKSKPLTRKEIAGALGVDSDAIGDTIKRLAAEEKIKSAEGRGAGVKYAIA